MPIVSAEYHRCAGLGNKLFPWSRAKILSDRLGCPFKAVPWFSPRGGALTRGGVNYRHALAKVWLVGNFRRDRDAVAEREFKRGYAELPIEVVDSLVGHDFSAPDRHYRFRWDCLQNFSDLWPYREFILERLLRVVRPCQDRYVRSFERHPFIALNIRTGKDFKHKSEPGDGYYLTELDWFVQALRTARKTYGDLPAFVVSDGGPAQLRPVLGEPGVQLVRTGTAVADLRILLKAAVLLGSGNSTFSGWASFLGGMDTYSSPETTFDHMKIAAPGARQIVSVL